METQPFKGYLGLLTSPSERVLLGPLFRKRDIYWGCDLYKWVQVENRNHRLWGESHHPSACFPGWRSWIKPFFLLDLESRKTPSCGLLLATYPPPTRYDNISTTVHKQPLSSSHQALGRSPLFQDARQWIALSLAQKNMRLETWISERLVLFTERSYLERPLLTPRWQALRGNPCCVSVTAGSYAFDDIHTDFLKMCLLY